MVEARTNAPGERSASINVTRFMVPGEAAAAVPAGVSPAGGTSRCFGPEALETPAVASVATVTPAFRPDADLEVPVPHGGQQSNQRLTRGYAESFRPFQQVFPWKGNVRVGRNLQAQYPPAVQETFAQGRGGEELVWGVQPQHVVMSAAAQARAADAQGLDQPATDYHTVPGRS